jgi:CheY-like chemotaxis protein
MVRVLVVDDEPDLVEAVADELESAGYLTGKAYDGV